MSKGSKYVKFTILVPRTKFKETREKLFNAGIKKVDFEFGYFEKIKTWIFQSGGSQEK